MKQVVTIGPDGTISGLQHKPGKGFDLRTLGKASIARASEVIWNEETQTWRVEFREGAGVFAGKPLTLLTVQQAGLDAAGLPIRWLASAESLLDAPVEFAEYDDGVQAEIAVLDGLRLAGKL